MGHRCSASPAQGMVIETSSTIRWAHLTIGTSSAGISPPELALICTMMDVRDPAASASRSSSGPCAARLRRLIAANDPASPWDTAAAHQEPWSEVT